MDRVVKRARPWRRWAVVAVAVIAVAAGVVIARRQLASGGRTLTVAGDRITTAEVKTGEFDDYIQIRGRFTPLTTVYIDTTQGGQVEAIHVENGARVEPGQLLVELSNTKLQLDVIAREAEITEQLNNVRGLELAHEQNRLAQEREAVEVDYQLVRLNREIKRSEALANSGTLPRGTLEEMRDERAYYQKRQTLLRESRQTVDRLERAQLAQLRTAAKQLEKNLTVTRANLAGLHVRATVPGQLTAFDLEVGQSLAPGERLGQIDDPSSYKILADIDEYYLGRVDVGQHAIYEADGVTYSLTVSKIRPQVTGSRFQVDLLFDGKAPSRVRRGQTAQIRLQLGQPTTTVLIPNAAFYHDTGGAWVFVVTSDGDEAIRRDVRLGRRNPQYIEVLDGLSPGEEIVTSPYTSFVDVQRLQLTARR